MKYYLYYKDLYESIIGDKGKPFDMMDEKWDNMRRKTFGNIKK